MRILIADDDPISSRLLERTLLRLGHEVDVVNDGAQAALALLHPDGPHFAIIDWMMPGADGLTVCRMVRERAHPYVYLVLLTSRDRREDVVAGLDAGADDFLIKPFDAVELGSRIRSGGRVLDLQERLLKAQAELHVLATRDDLTGLWNRRVVDEQILRELKRAKHEKKPVAVAIADLDHFKDVNDSHGHPVGDEVLRDIASRMKVSLRDYDALGRYGGEEFIAVLPGCDGNAATIAMERVRQAVLDHPVVVGPLSVPVTVSIGIAWTNPDGHSSSDLIRLADDALYRAKGDGRNRIVVWGPDREFPSE